MADKFYTRVRRLSRSKKLKIIAPYSTDLGLVIYWLRLNNAVSSVTKMRRYKNKYAVSVTPRTTDKKLELLVKEKFGVFAKVEKEK
jgi:hypothetical protein